MIRIGCIVLAMLLASIACAQTSGSSAPDIGAGKKRAATCFACHNADGISKIPGTPHLAGQDRGYLESTLRAYRDGQTRQNPTMNAMAKPLSDRDIANIAAYFSLQTRMNNGQTAAQALEMLERIRPVGNVVMEPPPVTAETSGNAAGRAAAVRSGEVIYQATCAACHSTGAAGAPKTGNKTDWSTRISQGTATLVQHATQGIKAMPAKGGCSTCSDTEIRAAVEYLISKSR